MKKNRIIKEVSVVFIFSILVFLCIKYIYQKYTSQSFDYVEKAIIQMYSENVDGALKDFNKAVLGNDKDVYEVINSFADEDTLNKFYENKDNKSFGFAEFREAKYLIFSNKIGEAIEKLKSSSEQGNVEATAFLATYLYSLKRFEEAYQYFEKAYNDKNYTVYPTYIDMKENLQEYKLMEELYIKYNQNKLNDEERLVLGKMFLEKDDEITAYQILKPFIEKKEPNSLYAKAAFLELEGENEKALKIYNELALNKYNKAILKIAQNSDISTKNARSKLIKFLDEVTDFDKEILLVKANLLFENDEWKKSKEIYDELYKLNYIPVYTKIAKYYENTGNYLEALSMYKKSFETGNLDAAINIANLIFEIQVNLGDTIEKEYMQYLKEASQLGNANASYEFSNRSSDEYVKRKYAIISMAQGKIEAIEILMDISNKNKDKDKIRTYTNILINNR